MGVSSLSSSASSSCTCNPLTRCHNSMTKAGKKILYILLNLQDIQSWPIGQGLHWSRITYGVQSCKMSSVQGMKLEVQQPCMVRNRASSRPCARIHLDKGGTEYLRCWHHRKRRLESRPACRVKLPQAPQGAARSCMHVSHRVMCSQLNADTKGSAYTISSGGCRGVARVAE